MNYYCKFCNQNFKPKGFSTHLKIHNTTFHKYVFENIIDFQPLWKICPVCQISITDKKTCSRKCGCKLRTLNNPARNIWAEMDEDTRIAAKSKIANKAKIRLKDINPWASWSPEAVCNAKIKLSQHATKNYGGINNPMYGRRHSPETIQKIISYRKMNKLESKFADFLNENNIDYYFQFFITDKSTHSFDFKIKNINLIIEIDGDYWHGGQGSKTHFKNVKKIIETDNIKNELCLNYNYKLIRIWEHDINNNFDEVKTNILNTIYNMNFKNI